RRRDGWTRALLPCPCEERAPVRRCHDLGARLARTVRIVPSQRITLSSRGAVFPGLVTFVTRDDHHRPQRLAASTGFQHVRGPLHVGRKGGKRIEVGSTNQGLRREMEYHIGPEGAQGG